MTGNNGGLLLDKHTAEDIETIKRMVTPSAVHTLVVAVTLAAQNPVPAPGCVHASSHCCRPQSYVTRPDGRQVGWNEDTKHMLHNMIGKGVLTLESMGCVIVIGHADNTHACQNAYVWLALKQFKSRPFAPADA